MTTVLLQRYVAHKVGSNVSGVAIRIGNVRMRCGLNMLMSKTIVASKKNNKVGSGILQTAVLILTSGGVFGGACFGTAATFFFLIIAIIRAMMPPLGGSTESSIEVCVDGVGTVSVDARFQATSGGWGRGSV